MSCQTYIGTNVEHTTYVEAPKGPPCIRPHVAPLLLLKDRALRGWSEDYGLARAARCAFISVSLAQIREGMKEGGRPWGQACGCGAGCGIVAFRMCPIASPGRLPGAPPPLLPGRLPDVQEARGCSGPPLPSALEEVQLVRRPVMPPATPAAAAGISVSAAVSAAVPSSFSAAVAAAPAALAAALPAIIIPCCGPIWPPGITKLDDSTHACPALASGCCSRPACTCWPG